MPMTTVMNMVSRRAMLYVAIRPMTLLEALFTYPENFPSTSVISAMVQTPIYSGGKAFQPHPHHFFHSCIKNNELNLWGRDKLDTDKGRDGHCQRHHGNFQLV